MKSFKIEFVSDMYGFGFVLPMVLPVSIMRVIFCGLLVFPVLRKKYEKKGQVIIGLATHIPEQNDTPVAVCMELV